MTKMDPVERLNQENKVKSGAGWFTIIGLLTLMNTFIALSGQDLGIKIGLGLTILTDAKGLMLYEQHGFVAKAGTFAVSFIAASIFFAIGVAASKRKVAMYVLGISLYAMDTLITVVTANFIAAGIHIVLLASLVIALKGCRKLNKIIELEDAMGDEGTDPLSQLFPHLDGKVGPQAGSEKKAEEIESLPLPTDSVEATHLETSPTEPADCIKDPFEEMALAMACSAVSEPAPPSEAAQHSAPQPTSSTSKLKVLYRD